MTKNEFIQIHDNSTLSLLEYCDSIFLGVSSRNSLKLENIQRLIKSFVILRAIVISSHCYLIKERSKLRNVFWLWGTMITFCTISSHTIFLPASGSLFLVVQLPLSFLLVSYYSTPCQLLVPWLFDDFPGQPSFKCTTQPLLLNRTEWHRVVGTWPAGNGCLQVPSAFVVWVRRAGFFV